ncbi:hypothetical protein SteCoe_26826 [Stentor coeruleus]|uniref:Histidine phosphatase family protein n=1 Tax=Stentor coeruleus TaxID=5963 RepID=A0A1R2BBT4_9CILI|nr:hypothetical protein SteCoe_26826 [Stentor coeruleus]
MHKLYIIRHAQTFYNKAQADYEEQGLPLLTAEFRWDPELADSVLSPQGIFQCQSAISNAHSLQVTKVFVSPLRRALETCEILFKDHPLHPNIIVHPQLHEVLHNGHDVTAYNGIPFPEYAHYDWSLIGDTFLPDLFINPKYAEDIKNGDFLIRRTKVLELMRKVNPDILEPDFDLYRRAQRSKEIWRRELEMNSIALVTHSSFLKQFTKVNFEEKGIWLQNCEIMEFSL